MLDRIRQYLRCWMDSLGEYVKWKYGVGVHIESPESKDKVRYNNK